MLLYFRFVIIEVNDVTEDMKPVELYMYVT